MRASTAVMPAAGARGPASFPRGRGTAARRAQGPRNGNTAARRRRTARQGPVAGRSAGSARGRGGRAHVAGELAQGPRSGTRTAAGPARAVRTSPASSPRGRGQEHGPPRGRRVPCARRRRARPGADIGDVARRARPGAAEREHGPPRGRRRRRGRGAVRTSPAKLAQGPRNGRGRAVRAGSGTLPPHSEPILCARNPQRSTPTLARFAAGVPTGGRLGLLISNLRLAL